MRGFTVALTLVAAAALSVSFFSAAKARNSRREVAKLKVETQRLTQANKSLEGNLQEVREKLARQESTTEELKEALAQEQPKPTPHAEVNKQVKSNVQTR